MTCLEIAFFVIINGFNFIYINYMIFNYIFFLISVFLYPASKRTHNQRPNAQWKPRQRQHCSWRTLQTLANSSKSCQHGLPSGQQIHAAFRIIFRSNNQKHGPASSNQWQNKNAQERTFSTGVPIEIGGSGCGTCSLFGVEV